MKYSSLQFYLKRHTLDNNPEREICVFSCQQGCKKYSKNQSAQLLELLHGCSRTNVPLTEALSNEPIFNTMVQRGSKPHEA